MRYVALTEESQRGAAEGLEIVVEGRADDRRNWSSATTASA